MVEYAGMTAALALLVSSLGGLSAGVGASLPTTAVNATHLVSAGAKRERVSAAAARAAYRKAPYRKPALKYLYAVGWIAASADPASCQVGRLFGSSPRQDALQALGRSPALLAKLRQAKLPRAVAARAIARGLVAGCG